MFESISPSPRVARKLWRFIRLLKKEDDSMYHSRLLILVWIHFRPFLREARKLSPLNTLLEKEDDS